MNIDMELELTAEDGSDPLDYIRDSLEKSGDLDPMAVVVGTSYASYVEYGTGPAQITGKKGVRTQTKARKNIKKWVERKYKKQVAGGGSSNEGDEPLADRMYRRIMDKGIHAHPFFRPAIYQTLDRMEKEYWVAGDWSTEALAEEMADRMRRILDDDGITFEGKLRDSIRVERLESVPDHPRSQIPDDVWRNPDIGKDYRRAWNRRNA